MRDAIQTLSERSVIGQILVSMLARRKVRLHDAHMNEECRGSPPRRGGAVRLVLLCPVVEFALR